MTMRSTNRQFGESRNPASSISGASWTPTFVGVTKAQ
jgi:hypothetical protein